MLIFPNIIFDWEKKYSVLKYYNFLIDEINFIIFWNFGLVVMLRNQLPKIGALKQSTALFCPISSKGAGHIALNLI